MKKALYILLAVLIMGMMGVGCEADSAVTYKSLQKFEDRVNSNYRDALIELNDKYNELKDENTQLKNQVDIAMKMHQDDTEMLQKRVNNIDSKFVDMQAYGIPFHTTDRESYAETGILIEVSTIDSIQSSGGSMSGRILARFNNINEAIQYLETFK